MSQSQHNWLPETTPISSEDAGYVSIDNTGPFDAGSYQRFTLTYTAGRYGIDDTGSLKICYRFASDMGRPQFTDPKAPNWIKVSASNGAKLEVRFDYKQNTRPWDRTIYVKVVAGFLREGDRIFVEFGTDISGPGIRMQTFADPDFQFRVLVDPIATYTYVEVDGVPKLPITPGDPATWHIVLPTNFRTGEPFRLSFRTDDIWGNPTSRWPNSDLRFEVKGRVTGLPQRVRPPASQRSFTIEGLVSDQSGEVQIDLFGKDGLLGSSNVLVVEDSLKLHAYWGDLHAQSGETIGSGTVEHYMEFARDLAFLDIVGHQGNDFQITQDFWGHLNEVMRRWNEPGRFVTVPGYEWSGNTALGGDRNVFYIEETREIYRSSHALVANRDDIASDCWNAHELFKALGGDFSRTVVWAHCGGRYADILYAHDVAVERSVEVHSSWGTFEWLAADAFKANYRIGIVGNSDGHKGRPGSEPPGASMFGALGGLTCYWMNDLSRTSLFDAMHARHHYATTGSRVHLKASVSFQTPATVWVDDPAVPGARSAQSNDAIMGDIVTTPEIAVEFRGEVVASAAILSIEIRRGTEVIEMIRPHDGLELAPRVRVEWSGAEYRGRARQVVWDGNISVKGATIVAAEAINFFNPDRPLKLESKQRASWQSITTGNFGGVEVTLSDDNAAIEIETPLGKVVHSVSDLEHRPKITAFGKLGRELRVSRQPATRSCTSYKFARTIPLTDGDNPIWICATFDDGHQAWTSPIYFLK